MVEWSGGTNVRIVAAGVHAEVLSGGGSGGPCRTVVEAEEEEVKD